MAAEPINSRRERNARAIASAGLASLACALPTNVLLLSGYWPVVGTSIAIAGGNGRVVLVVPEDERYLARKGWADTVLTFKPASLDALFSLSTAVSGPLEEAMTILDSGVGLVGYEAAAWNEPMSYIAINLYGERIREMVSKIPICGQAIAADELLMQMRTVQTHEVIKTIEAACALAGAMFEAAPSHLLCHRSEIDAAAQLQAMLSDPDADRSQGHVSVMSGSRSAEAYGSFARSTAKHLSCNELVLVHCNSTVGGFWTDITRTFIMREPNKRQSKMYQAVFLARDAALDRIKPGAKAADVDLAARKVIESAGYGNQFRHSTGHGVAFSATDHNARPRVHPKSPDILEEGMVFNVEPAIYVEDVDGLRHCDMVEVTADGARVLTPFRSRLEQLQIAG
jgi:Xaa-Pro aminopeptidase